MTISESKMKTFALFVAVLLSAEAATVPSNVTHKVTVPVPGNVLSASKDADVEVPAVVVEVTKDHKHNPDMMQQLMALEMENTMGKQEGTEVTPKGVQAGTNPATEGSGDGHVVPSNVPSVVPTVVSPVVPSIVHADASSVSSPVVPPVISSVIATDSSPVVPTVVTPVVPKVISPVVPPVVTPVVPPVVEPVVSPVVSPVTSPVVAPVVSPVLSSIVPPVVSTVLPQINSLKPIQVPQNVHHVHDVSAKSTEGQIVHLPNADQKLTTDMQEPQKLVTVVPVLDDVVTKMNDDETTTASDTEDVTTDVTTNVPEGEETTTEAMDDTTNNPNDVVVTTVSAMEGEVVKVTPSKSNEVTMKEDSGSSEESKEETPKKDSSNDSSSSSEESKEKKNTIVHNHNGEQATVTSAPSIPSVIEDIIPHPADIFASEGGADSDTVVMRRRRDTDHSEVMASKATHDEKNSATSLDKNNQHTESKSDALNTVLAMRPRRAIPFREPTVVIPASSKPKLETNPKVIAEILAKSKNLQKRYKKSIADKDQVATTKVPLTLVEKVDKTEDMSATLDPCDLLCTKFEFEPICASNGLCLHEFSNQCILDTYNCKHPKNKFLATKDDRCLMTWLEFCSENEMI